MFAFSTLAIAASLAAAVAADHGHDLHARSHHHVARSNLQKRFSGTATYYITGLGACGQYNSPSDHIVALNSAQYGGGYPGPNCFKPITICAKGKCVGATITDECPTCDYGSLDLSQGLFEQFAPTSDGVFQMTWTFADGSGETKPTTTKKPDPTTTKKPDPEPTTTWKPEPTTTWEEPTTTSTKKKTSTWSPPPETTSTPEPTTTSSSTSSTPSTTSTSTVVSTSTSAAASVAAASSATGTSAAPSASASSGSTGGSGTNSGSGSGSNLADAQQVMIAMGNLVTSAKK